MIRCAVLGLACAGLVGCSTIGDPGSRATGIIGLLTTEVACSALTKARSEVSYANTDFFDCELSKSLKQNSGSTVLVKVPEGVSASLPAGSENNGALVKQMPDRLKAWARAVQQNDGQVAVCIVNSGTEFWQVLVSLGLALIEGIANDRVANRYAPSSDYNLSVIFDGSDTSNLKLQELSFTKKSEGPIVNDQCQYAAEGI